jgi:hypothetical protein
LQEIDNINELLDLVRTEWDVDRYSERVKISRVNADGHISDADRNLQNYFEPAEFGDIDLPATIIDCHGRIIAWHLPSILCNHRIVRKHCISRRN